MCFLWLHQDSFHTFKTAGDIFYIKEDITSKGSDLVYVVICCKCNEEYIWEIGQGKRRVRYRVRIYPQDIRQLQ